MIDRGVDGESTVRTLIFQALKQYSIDALLPLLEDKSRVVRSAAARELQIRGSKEIFDRGRALLKANRRSVREIAAFLIGQLGTPDFPFKEESLPLLEKCLQTDSSGRVREAAAAALGHLGSAKSIPTLLMAARDTDAGVRASVAASLGQFGFEQKVKKTLKRLARDPDADVREWARYSLS